MFNELFSKISVALEAMKHDPVNFAPPFFILLILIELLIIHRGNKIYYNGKEAWSSIAMGVGVLFIGLPIKIIVYFAFTYLHQFAPHSWVEFLSFKNWWSWVLLLLADDFSFYWHHRLSHEVRLLWAAHVNHHSSQTLNLATALRQSWTEPIYKYTFFMWMPLIGFDPLFVLSMHSVSLIYQFLMHTELVWKLGPVEWIFNTPSHHRVHHATNVRYLDRNHAGILIIWDRLFGTFEEERAEEKPIYGITKNIESYNPFVIATHEFVNIYQDLKKARNWRERMGYLFAPPGWSPDGNGQTTRQLRKTHGLDS